MTEQPNPSPIRLITVLKLAMWTAVLIVSTVVIGNSLQG